MQCYLAGAKKMLASAEGARYYERVIITNMKAFPLFSLLALAALTLSPLALMPAAAQGAAAAEAPAAPSTGVRFVIVSPSGDTIPSPLYCKQGKTFVPVRIGARAASQRVKPEAGGIVRFWKENPMPTADAAAFDGTAGGKTAARPNRRASSATAAVPEAKLPEPFMTVQLPSGVDSKTLCILVPNKDGKAQTFFVDEKDVPASGIHIINFSPYPLQMLLSQKGDFSDKVTQNISYFQRSEGITAKNRWSFKGKDGESMAFMLMFKSGKDKEFRRVRASRFVVTEKQSQISVVVKDPSREAVKLINIQLMR